MRIWSEGRPCVVSTLTSAAPGTVATLCATRAASRARTSRSGPKILMPRSPRTPTPSMSALIQLREELTAQIREERGAESDEEQCPADRRPPVTHGPLERRLVSASEPLQDWVLPLPMAAQEIGAQGGEQRQGEDQGAGERH